MAGEQTERFNDEQRRSFDRLYDRFLEPIPGDVLERMERIVEAGVICEGDVVLDVGTGTGALIPLIHRRHPAEVFACDLSGKMLEQVAVRFPDVRFYQQDVRDLALPSSSIDVVFMNGMFGNIADKEGALRNITRMLRPGGRAVIGHPEGRAYVARIAQQHPFPITPLPSKAEARQLFGTAGLRLARYVDKERLLIAVAEQAARPES